MIKKILLCLLSCNTGGTIVYLTHSYQNTAKDENNGVSDTITCVQESYDPLYVRNLNIEHNIDFDINYKTLILSNETKTLVPQQFIKSLQQTTSVTNQQWDEWIGDRLNYSQAISYVSNAAHNVVYDWTTDFINNTKLEINDNKAVINTESTRQINNSQEMRETTCPIQYSTDNKIIDDNAATLYEHIGSANGNITSGCDIDGTGTIKYHLMDANLISYPTMMYWTHLGIPFNLHAQTQEHNVEYSTFDLSNIICVTKNNWQDKTITFGLNEKKFDENKELINNLIKNNLNISIYYKVKDPQTNICKNLIANFKLDSLSAEKEIQIDDNSDFTVTSIKSDEINDDSFYISPNETSKISSNCSNISFDDNGHCQFTRPEISSVLWKDKNAFNLKTLSCYSDEELINKFFILLDAYGNKITFDDYYDKYISIARNEEGGSFIVKFFDFSGNCVFDKKVSGFKTDKNLDIIMDEKSLTTCDLEKKQNCDALLAKNEYSIYEKYICSEIDNVAGECILQCFNSESESPLISYKIINLIPYYIIQKEIPKALQKINPKKITEKVALDSLIEESDFFKEHNSLDISLSISDNILVVDICYQDYFSKKNIGEQYKFNFTDNKKTIKTEMIIIACFVSLILLFFAFKIFIDQKKKKLGH